MGHGEEGEGVEKTRGKGGRRARERVPRAFRYDIKRGSELGTHAEVTRK